VEDVVEYSFAKDASLLIYTVSSKKEESNGVYTLKPGNEAAAVPLIAGKGKYSKLTWDLTQKQVAFLSDRDEPGAKPLKFKAYLWDRKSAPVVAVSSVTPGFRGDYGLAEAGPISFSRDASKLFVSAAPLDKLAAAAAAAGSGLALLR